MNQVYCKHVKGDKSSENTIVDSKLKEGDWPGPH